MNKFSLFLSLGMLFFLCSCDDSLNSVEDTDNLISEQSQLENNKEFVTYTNANGETIQARIPEELKENNEMASPRMMCEMTVINPTSTFSYVSVSNYGVYAFPNSSTTVDCPCSGYIWHVGGGSNISYSLIGGGSVSGSLNSGHWTYY